MHMAWYSPPDMDIPWIGPGVEERSFHVVPQIGLDGLSWSCTFSYLTHAHGECRSTKGESMTKP
jgi:hypothetical protein